MSKQSEPSSKWRLIFAWTDGIASARMSVVVDLPHANQAGSPVAMITSIADKFGIPIAKCTEASAERLDPDRDDDGTF